MKQHLKRLPIYGAIFVLIFVICQVFFTPGLNETAVRVQMICPANDEYQLFYQNNEITEFNETNSIKQAIVGSKKMQEIKFALNNQDFTQVRLDLGTQSEKTIIIEELAFIKLDRRAQYTTTELKEEIATKKIILHDLEVLSNENSNILQLKTIGNDPFIQFAQPNLQPVKVSQPFFWPFVIAILLTVFIYRYVYLKEIVAFFRDLYQNKQLIFSLAVNDFKTKYAGSYFGIIWAFVQPICTILVFWFVFEVGFRSSSVSDVPFALWLSCGMVPWFFFSDGLVGASYAFIEYNYLVKKVVFKISVLPVVKILSALFVHLFFIVFLFILFACYRLYPTLAALQIVYYTVCLCALLVSISFISASVIVFFKDLGQIISIFLQFGMWLTPIMWSVNIMPAKYLAIIKLNPMYYVVDGYRNALIYSQPLFYDIKLSLYFWVITISLFVIGIVLFYKLRSHFADTL